MESVRRNPNENIIMLQKDTIIDGYKVAKGIAYGMFFFRKQFLIFVGQFGEFYEVPSLDGCDKYALNFEPLKLVPRMLCMEVCVLKQDMAPFHKTLSKGQEAGKFNFNVISLSGRSIGALGFAQLC